MQLVDGNSLMDMSLHSLSKVEGSILMIHLFVRNVLSARPLLIIRISIFQVSYKRELVVTCAYLILGDLNTDVKQLTVCFGVRIVSTCDLVFTGEPCFWDGIR